MILSVAVSLSFQRFDPAFFPEGRAGPQLKPTPAEDYSPLAGARSNSTRDRKRAGKPIAGNRHDGFEVAGAGTQLTVRLVRASQRERGEKEKGRLPGVGGWP